MSLEHSIKALQLLKCFNPALSHLLIENWQLGSNASLVYK